MCRVCAKCIKPYACDEIVQRENGDRASMNRKRWDDKSATIWICKAKRGRKLQMYTHMHTHYIENWYSEKEKKREKKQNSNNNVRWIGYFSSDRSCIICGIYIFFSRSPICVCRACAHILCINVTLGLCLLTVCLHRDSVLDVMCNSHWWVAFSLYVSLKFGSVSLWIAHTICTL